MTHKMSCNFKYWNGTEWIKKSLFYWNGTEWKVKTLKFWNGTAWI